MRIPGLRGGGEEKTGAENRMEIFHAATVRHFLLFRKARSGQHHLQNNELSLTVSHPFTQTGVINEFYRYDQKMVGRRG